MNNATAIAFIIVGLLIIKTISMSAEILAELKAEAAKTRQSLSNIRGDIARILENLPAEGGLTADEVAELKVELTGLSTDADTLDKENEPETES